MEMPDQAEGHHHLEHFYLLLAEKVERGGVLVIQKLRAEMAEARFVEEAF